MVKEVTLPERHYVGMALTSPFAGHDPQCVEQLKKQFIARRFEIKGLVDAELMYVRHSYPINCLRICSAWRYLRCPSFLKE
ncbi:hypothetical protein DL346_06395 [Paenibacillus montanisoli]|uniref:Uncharacterized protein n=1 Tax=Paenibacillus montanisoli TaxID=2081970 RepID=A0A328U5E3_9BACL|nr:hypothetical protein DL346_06395 [Paenibacillus montanisoli]